MKKRQKNPAFNFANGCAVLVLLSVVLGLALIACGVIALFSGSNPSTSTPSTATLDLAYSPEKDTLMQDLVTRFNRAGYRTPSGQTMAINATKMDAADIVDAARAGRFTAVSPDSSLWLTQIDAGLDRPLVGETTRFAVTPVVIAMWSDTAASLGYPQKPVGW